MKLALLLLLCLVSVSYQQRSSYPGRSYYYKDPRFFFYYPQYAPYFQQLEDNYDSNSQGDGQELYSDVEGRRPAFSNQLLKPQNRFFFGNNLLSYGNGLFTTSTTTKYSVVTSTATLASVQSCIGANQFFTSNTVVGATALTSTAPCSRRRRSAEMIDLLQEVSEPIEPSPTAALEITNPPAVNHKRSYDFESSVELAASLMDEQEQRIQPRLALVGSNNNADRVILLTVSSTFTSFSFVTTTVKRSFTLVTSSYLVCLPSGFSIC